MRSRQRLRLRALVGLLGLALVAFSACGNDEGDGDGVASMSGDDKESEAADSEAADSDDKASPQEIEDASLEYAQCMRDHGIDMPDPETSEDGKVQVAIPGGSSGEGEADPKMEAAQQECQPIMDEAMGEMEGPSPEEEAEMQDQMIKVAECMRAKGYDMEDPKVEDGRVMMDAPSGGEASDEQMQADMEACNEAAGLDIPGGGNITERAD